MSINPTPVPTISVNPNTTSSPVRNTGYYDAFSKLVTPESILLLCLIITTAYKVYIPPISESLKDKLSQASDFDEQVGSILNQYLALTSADRICLSMFHNGEKYINGSKYRKSSVTHEVVRPGISRVARFQKAIPLSLLTETVKLCHTDPNHIAVSDVDCTEFAGFYKDDIGASNMVAIGINHQDKDLGLITLHFVTDKVSISDITVKLREDASLKSLYNRLFNKMTYRNKNIISLIYEQYMSLKL